MDKGGKEHRWNMIWKNSAQMEIWTPNLLIPNPAGKPLQHMYLYAYTYIIKIVDNTFIKYYWEAKRRALKYLNIDDKRIHSKTLTIH